MLKTILITNDPLLAADAESAGVDRVMVDLETHGKKERQASRRTFISAHAGEDVAKIRAVLSRAELIVRVNPWHFGSPEEIDHAVAGGADIVMLPMITRLAQWDAFLARLKGRAQPLPLIETGYAMAHIGAIAAYAETEEVYIGFNDLHLSLGLDFLFEPLALGLVDWMAGKIKERGKPFGFGGVGAIGVGGELPAECVLGEHLRLGSSRVILSSRFAKDVGLADPEGRRDRLAQALRALRETCERLRRRGSEAVEADRADAHARIRALAEAARRKEE